jgi:hypothetical protein
MIRAGQVVETPVRLASAMVAVTWSDAPARKERSGPADVSLPPHGTLGTTIIGLAANTLPTTIISAAVVVIVEAKLEGRPEVVRGGIFEFRRASGSCCPLSQVDVGDEDPSSLRRPRRWRAMLCRG